MRSLLKNKGLMIIFILLGLYLFIIDGLLSIHIIPLNFLPIVLTQIIGLALLVMGIVMLVHQIKHKIFKINNEYLGAKVISFCFPVIGLIIYAVNIGKNNELAKGCSKWAIIGFIIYAIIIIVQIL